MAISTTRTGVTNLFRQHAYTVTIEYTMMIKQWLATDPVNADRKMIIAKEWKELWQGEVDRSRARHRGRAGEPADVPPTNERLKLHDGLYKAESSLLVQMR
jgi:hypothetical protein